MLLLVLYLVCRSTGALPWGVSFPDLAVGRGEWVQARGDRLSRATVALARGVGGAGGAGAGLLLYLYYC